MEIQLPSGHKSKQAILLVEDNPITQKLVQFTLAQAGYDILEATTGQMAIDWVGKRRPDLILQDLVLPDMDGFELALELRARLEGPRVPLIAFSGLASMSDEARVSAAGFDGHMVKPIEPSRLLQIVGSYLPVAFEPALDRFGAGRLIVVADDNLLQLTLARLRLESMGFEVVTAADGMEALERARARKPAAILADVMMPRMDGFGVCVEARRDPVLRDVPVILVTSTYVDAADRKLGREAGASEYVVRTPDLKEVVAALREAIGRPLAGPRATAVVPPEFEREHSRRVIQQLERQVGLNAGVSQRCSQLAAELSILAGISNALCRGEDLEGSLDEVLAAFFDAAGISTGALLLLDPLRVHALGGAAKWGRDPRALFIGELQELRDLLAAGRPLRLPFGAGQLPETSKALESAGIRTGLILPLTQQSALMGMLVLSYPASASPSDDQVLLAVGVAGQIAQGVALARAFAARTAAEREAEARAVTLQAMIDSERATQEQLMVSDRMASVGTLAAEVAHEINNPLAVVVANLDFAVADGANFAAEVGVSPRLTELQECLHDAAEAAQRVRQIVKDLKIFSRTEEKTGPVDVQRILESTLRMTWNEIRHRARLVRSYTETPPVEASDSRLGQVFLNLIVNAAQAMEEGHAEDNEIRVSTSVDPTGDVVIEIADTGVGMPPEVLHRLFTPFFTTKPVGVGTGLGLSICQRIVTGFGGSLDVKSEVGKGTVFRVVLPAARGAATGEAPCVVPGKAAARRGRILVVDDEPMIASVVRRALSAEHDVVAGTATQALEGIGAGERFDVIFCDLMMPQLTGMDLHAKLARLAPEQADRMIFLSGGAFTPRARAFLDESPNQFLEKPFDAGQLRALVNERVT